MLENIQRFQDYCRYFVIGMTLVIVLCLAKSTYYINYWPSDSQNPYIPTAARLFDLPFLSQMHDLPIDNQLKLTMHGKETLILGIAIMQRILNDFQSLYPNVLLLILATGISSILIYYIFARLFNSTIGLLAYLLFAGCFWSYMYIFQGAHQPLVLMNCLIVVFLLLKEEQSFFLDLLAGAFLGFFFFSSPTSPTYLPYIIGAFCYRTFYRRISPGLSILGIFIGWLAIFLLFTLPHPIDTMKGFVSFLRFSQFGNNFNIYYEHMYQYYPIPVHFRGAGISWIFKYFFLSVPVLFTGYWISAAYLLKKSFQKPLLLELIILSLLPPIAIEISHVAQFGRNYFSWLPGLIFLNCLAVDHFYRERKNQKDQTIATILLILFLGSHLLYNAHIFFTDVYPSKMTTTWVHQWLTKNDQRQVYVYADHPYNLNLVTFLNNPKDKEKISVREIHNLREASEGLIYLLPITGKSIYKECRENDFYRDPDLTRLYQSPEFSKYVLASFKTFASSRMWTQEEEICTYLDLELGLIKDEDRQKGLAYILDAKKIQAEWFSKNKIPLK